MRGARIVPAQEGMAEAVVRLRAGQLVAFPTETVYGLGANALDAEAVARIFAAKGRPSTNPVIVHVADEPSAQRLAAHWPEQATILAMAFWPGPLTLVVPRSPEVPAIVTAGGQTVGLRVPKHPVALALLQKADVPVAAPSANRSEEVSPTTAQHVADSLGPWVDDLLILDGGSCEVGIESTVVDLTFLPPRILRPGIVTASQIRKQIGSLSRAASGWAEVAKSPGQMPRHYAPRAQVLVLTDDEIFGMPRLRPGEQPDRDAWKQSILQPTDAYLWRNLWPGAGNIPNIHMPIGPVEYARRLYSALRAMDGPEVKRIIIQMPPTGGAWTAVHDRLNRAATPSHREDAS